MDNYSNKYRYKNSLPIQAWSLNSGYCPKLRKDVIFVDFILPESTVEKQKYHSMEFGFLFEFLAFDTDLVNPKKIQNVQRLMYSENTDFQDLPNTDPDQEKRILVRVCCLDTEKSTRHNVVSCIGWEVRCNKKLTGRFWISVNDPCSLEFDSEDTQKDIDLRPGLILRSGYRPFKFDPRFLIKSTTWIFDLLEMQSYLDQRFFSFKDLLPGTGYFVQMGYDSKICPGIDTKDSCSKWAEFWYPKNSDPWKNKIFDHYSRCPRTDYGLLNLDQKEKNDQESNRALSQINIAWSTSE